MVRPLSTLSALDFIVEVHCGDRALPLTRLLGRY